MAQKYNLPEAYKGDTYDTVQFTMKLNDVAIDLTGYTIKSQFKKNKKTGQLSKTISTTSGITITDAENGIFVIDSFVVDLNAGDYFYDIQFTDSNDIVTTYIQGRLQVIQDVTNG
jgi:cytoplasmic iron level regulating protein YaaA (DUF328/UPF0246 family)